MTRRTVLIDPEIHSAIKQVAAKMSAAGPVVSVQDMTDELLRQGLRAIGEPLKDAPDEETADR